MRDKCTSMLAALALAVGLSGAVQQAAAQDAAIDQIMERGQLNVGMATFVPWAMRDKKGELIGFEIDVATKLAEDLGVEVNFVPTAWDGIIPALLAGKFDVIIGGMTITTKRNLTVNFTEAYAHSGMRLVVNKKLVGDRNTLEAFNDSSITMTARRGSSAMAFIQRYLPKTNLRLFDDAGQSLLELVNDRATAAFGYDPTPALWLSRYPDKLRIGLDGKFNQGSEGFAIRKNDSSTLNVFNNWIKARWLDGFLKERSAYWFQGRDWAHLVPDK
jgi:polar amino acid transport system substrate-binding protein